MHKESFACKEKLTGAAKRLSVQPRPDRLKTPGPAPTIGSS
jgi:hypothetical protein